MPDWRTPRLKRQMLSRNRLTEESPQVDLRSSNQKHGYSVRTVWPSPAPPETSCAVARPARAARRRKRAESHARRSKPPESSAESRRMCAWAAWSDRRAREGNEPCRSRRAPAPRRSRGNGGSGEPSRAAATPPLDECRVRAESSGQFRRRRASGRRFPGDGVDHG